MTEHIWDVQAQRQRLAAQARQHADYMERRNKHMADGMWCEARLWEVQDGHPLDNKDAQAIEAWVTAAVQRLYGAVMVDK